MNPMPSRVVAHGHAKINLSLDIVGRREDGYHLLEMVMQSLAVCDTLVIERRPAGELRLVCDDPALPCDGRNTAYRAAAAYLAATGAGGAMLTLTKRLPYQAGLGSASADAAAALRGLNALYDHRLDEAALLALGLTVGADVPFCLTGGTRLAEGVGERLTPLAPLPDCAVLLVKPREGLSTPEAYRRFDALAAPARPDTAGLCAALAAGDLPGLARRCHNVFEADCPVGEVAQIKRQLLEQSALGAAMSGSGTAVFGLFADGGRAAAAQAALTGSGRTLLLTRPVGRGVTLEAGE